MEFHVPGIEEEYEAGNFDKRPFLERYFVKRYFCDPKGGDYTLLIHSNKICIITLAPSHPILSDGITVTSVSFQANDRLNRLDNRVTGKKKQGAQLLATTSILCSINCEGLAKPFIVRSWMVAKLMEVNSRLVDNSDLLKSNAFGYIAVIFPKRGEFDREIGRWMTEEEYQKVLLERQNQQSSTSNTIPTPATPE